VADSFWATPRTPVPSTTKATAPAQVAWDGEVFSYGDTVYSGSTGSIAMNAPTVDMSGVGLAT
jgi:hypothetical protein